jgi:acetyl esterase/lipase
VRGVSRNILAKRAGRSASLALALALISQAASAQTPAGARQIVSLYPPGTTTPLGAPETRRIEKTGGAIIFNVSDPTLEVFRPRAGHANGTAVIVAPGGGFVGVEYDAGGTEVARRLAQHGVTAFVLKYRTIRSADDPMKLPPVHQKEMTAMMARARTGVPLEAPRFAGEPHAVEDGARALSLVRSRASEWGVDPKRVGVLGFSAGAYLAADLAIGPPTSRPDFVGLIYGGLRTPVPPDASPAFIAAAADDEYQPNDAALLFAAWRRAGASDA